MLELNYVNRRIISIDGILDDRKLIDVIEREGLVLIYGLPGVGKTSTASYIACKFLDEGWDVIIFKPTVSIEGEGPRILDVRYDDSKRGILISVPFYYDVLTKSEVYLERMCELIYEVLKVGRDDDVRELVKKAIKGEIVKDELLKVLGDKFEDVLSLRTNGASYTEILGDFAGTTKDVLDLLSGLSILGKKVVQNLSLVLGLWLILVDTIKLKDYAVKFLTRWRSEDFRFDRLLVVVDDFEDIKGGKEDVARFLKSLKDRGAKVLVVKRASYEGGFEEFFKIVGNARRKDEIISILRDRTGLEDLSRKNVFFMFGTEREEFEEILRRNVGKEKLKDVNVDDYYRATFGMPYLAVAMLEKGVKPRIEDVDVYWRSKPFTELREEDVQAMLRCMAYNMLGIYRKLKRNFAMIPLLIQPIGEEDLRKFCKRVEEYVKDLDVDGEAVECRSRLDRGDVVRVKMEEKLNLDGGEVVRKVTVYDLEEKSKKLRVFMESLFKIYEITETEDEELKEDLKNLREEILMVRKILLEIATERFRDFGSAFFFEAYHSLDNARFLIEMGKGDDFVRNALVNWCAYALYGAPRIAGEFIGYTYNRVKEDLEKGRVTKYHLSFLFHCVSRLRDVSVSVGGYSIEMIEVEDLVGRVDGKGNETIEAWKISILSGIASVKGYEEGKKSFEELERNLSNLSGDLKDFIEIRVKLTYADLCLRNGRPEEAIKVLEVVKKKIDKLLGKSNYTDNLLKYFEINGRKRVRKAIKGSLKLHKAYYYSSLGRALMDLDKLEEAEKEFESAMKIYKDLNWEGYIKSWMFIKRIRAIRGIYEFDELYKEARERLVQLDHLTHSQIVAKYVVSKALKGEYTDLKEINHLIPHIKRITIGILRLLDVNLDKKLAIKSLKEFEVEIAFDIFVGKVLGRIDGLSLFRSNPKFYELVGYLCVEMSMMGIEIDTDDVLFFSQFLFDHRNIENLGRLLGELKSGKSLDELTKDKKAGEALSRITKITLNSQPINSQQAFARALRLYLSGSIEKAISLAENISTDIPPLPSRLFRELAKALREELNAKNEDEKAKAKEKVKSAFVRLFYLHV